MAPDRTYKECDVRLILAEGRQPLTEIQSAIQALGGDEGLKVIAPFAPTPLIRMLAEAGFTARVERGAEGEVIVHLWKKEIDDDFCNR